MKIRDDVKVELVQSLGDDRVIVAAARVSTGTDGKALKEAEGEGFIDFLMKNRHGSPFEHGSMTFRIEAPIFVAREFFRHRVGWSYNEESGRYKVLGGEFYVPGPNRPLKQVGKPGAYDFVATDEPDLWVRMSRRMKIAYMFAWTTYTALLAMKIPKEVARMVLPVGVYTSFYATCNPRSLMHFLSLRTKDERSTYPSFPMWEIEQVARGMEEHFTAEYPVTATSFHRNGRVAP